MMMMAVTMVYWRRGEYLSQYFFLEFPVYSCDTPAALLSQWGTIRAFCSREANITLVSPMILRIRAADPGVGSSRASRWQTKKVLWDDVAIVFEHNLGYRRYLLRMTHDPGLSAVFLLLSTVFVIHGCIGTCRDDGVLLRFIFGLFALGSFTIGNVEHTNVPSSAS